MPVPSQGHYGFHSFMKLNDGQEIEDFFCQLTEKGQLLTNKGNNKITELRTILQRESPNS
jgi:hypothetical protein